MNYRKNFRVFIKKNVALLFSVFIALLAFTTLPIWAGVESLNKIAINTQYNSFGLGAGNYIFSTIPITALMIISALPLITLKHIYNPNDLDTYFSINVPRERLLFSDILNTYLLFFIPYIIFAVINGTIVYLGLGSNIIGVMSLYRYIILIIATALFGIFCVAVVSFVMTACTNLGSAVVYSIVALYLPYMYANILKTFVKIFVDSEWYARSDNLINLFNPFSNIVHLSINSDFYTSLLMILLFSFLGIVILVCALKNFGRYKVENINGDEQVLGFYSKLTYLFGIGFYIELFSGVFRDYTDSITGSIFILSIGLVAYYGVMMVRGKGKVNWSKLLSNYFIISAIGLLLGFLLSAFSEF